METLLCVGQTGTALLLMMVAWDLYRHRQAVEDKEE